MTEEQLLRRTKQFALRVMKLSGALPNTPTARTIAPQLVRSGTSVGANYRAACRGRSRAEFAAKLGVVEEEADESAYWMELITEGSLLRESLVRPLHDEAIDLTKITASSRITTIARTAAGGLNRKSQIANRK